MIITSKDNNKFKELLYLKTSKGRRELNKFIVEGPHLVKEAKLKNILIEAYSIKAKEGYNILSESLMKKISSTSSVVEEIGICKIIENDDLTNKIIILDNVQDPGNIGAIMRSACAFGFKTIILGEGCCDIYNDKVIRSSQGAIFKLSFKHENLIKFIPTLKDYDLYGTDVRNGIKLDDVKNNDKLAIVLGNEGNGINEEVFKLLNKNIYIPMDDTESLNVSVAASIIMYKLR